MGSKVRASLAMEVKRKTIHLSGLSVPASILFFGKATTVGLVALALGAALFLERRRLAGKVKLPAVRDSEADRVAGYVYYIFGALLAVLLFSPAIAIAAMLMLSLGDAASGIIGSVVGGSGVRAGIIEGQGWKPKPLPVVVGTFAVCLVMGYGAHLLEVRFFSGPELLSFPVFLVGAVAATVADAVPLSLQKRVIDDNLSIPVFSGVAMTVAGLL
jgi:dolichol kinase